MPEQPFPLWGRTPQDQMNQVMRLIEDLYQESLGGAKLGDVFEIGDDDILALKIADASLEKSATGLSVQIDPDGGIQTTTDGVSTKLKSGGNLGSSVDGLYVLPGVNKGYREGLNVTIKDADELYVSGGAIEIAGVSYTNSVQLTLPVGTVSPNTTYYIYVDAPTSGTVLAVGDFTLSTTAPVFSDTLGALYMTGDLTKRYVGRIYVAAVGDLVNFALTGTPTAQSEFDAPTHQIIYGNDGNTTTAWWANAINHWWKVDLGAEKTFESIYVQTESTISYSLTIEGSHDNSAWELIVEDPAAARAALTLVPISGAKTYRYVRITPKNATNVSTLREIQLWGYASTTVGYVSEPRLIEVAYDSDNVPNDNDVLYYDATDGIYKPTSTPTLSQVIGLSAPDANGEAIRATTKITEVNLESAVDLKHAQSHAITSTSDHTSTATSGQLLKADANGLPVNATNTDTQVLETVREALTGFVNRTDSTLGMSGANLQVTTASSFVFYSEGKKYTKTTTQEVAITNDNTLHFVYFDNNGTLQVSTDEWTINSDKALCALVYKTGATYAVFDERHSYNRNRRWHSWAHYTVGVRYFSGLTGTFADTTLSITQGVIEDEDIVINTGGALTACRLWYRNTGAASMTFESNVTTPYKIVTGALKYDSSGTLTSVSNNYYTCSYVYATADKDYPIAVVVGQAQYQNTPAGLDAARAEAVPTIPGTINIEWKLIYQVIYQNAGGSPDYIEANDRRTVSTGPAGIVTSGSHAALVDRSLPDQHPASAITSLVAVARNITLMR